MTREDAARKIRALLATSAEGSGATAPERATARRLAEKLLAAHGLKKSDLPNREIEIRLPPPMRTPETVFVVITPYFTVLSTTNDTGWTFSGPANKFQ